MKEPASKKILLHNISPSHRGQSIPILSRYLFKKLGYKVCPEGEQLQELLVLCLIQAITVSHCSYFMTAFSLRSMWQWGWHSWTVNDTQKTDVNRCLHTTPSCHWTYMFAACYGTDKIGFWANKFVFKILHNCFIGTPLLLQLVAVNKTLWLFL